MFGIMHNHFIDGVRAANRRADQTVPGELPDAPVRATQTDRLEVRDLERSLQALPAEQREVLLLVCVEDLSYQETAQILDVPMGTVMSRLSRAREKLGVLLQGRDAVNRLHRVK
jgi:RNA polymerase sigma-70 factor (ECF subfamily)